MLNINISVIILLIIKVGVSVEITEKFLNQKQKIIVSYAKKISEFISDENIEIFNGKVEFNQLLNLFVKKYLDFYYFNRENEFIIYADYCEFNISGNNEINIMLHEITNYYRNNQKESLLNNKGNIYYLAFIISNAIKTDRIFNSISKNRKYNKEVENIIQSIRNNKNLKAKKKSKNKVMEFIKLIQQNIEREQQFFNYFNIIEIKNKFKKLKAFSNHYFVKYEYYIDENKFKKEYIEKMFKKAKVDDIYLPISYELLSLTILKENSISNIKNKYIVPINRTLINNEQDIKKISKIFAKKEIRKQVKFLIEEKIVIENPGILEKLKAKGFNLCTMLNINENEIKGIEVIRENKEVYLNSRENYIDEQELLKYILGKESEKWAL